MDHYIILEDDVIKVYHKASGDRPNNEIKISKTQFNKISSEPGKINKYISKKVVVEDDPNYLEELKDKKEQEVNQQTNSDIISGFEYPLGSGNIHKFDYESQMNLIALRSMALTNSITEDLETTLKNGDFVIIPKDDVIEYTSLGFKHKDDLLAENKVKRKQIRACTTINELEGL